MLPTSLIPQADSPPRLIGLLRHLAEHGTDELPEDFRRPRDLGYVKNALRMLGWLDASNTPTPAARALPADDRQLRRAFLLALEQSPVGVAWMAHFGLDTLVEADPKGIDAFLAAETTLAPATLSRRADTLRRWLKWALGRPEGPQVGLFESAPLISRWPDPRRFPHNEGGEVVGGVVEGDLAEPGDVLMVVGFASLDRVIRLLANGELGEGSRLRILIGNEPHAARRDAASPSRRRLPDEVRDYWLQRGISVLHVGDVIAARTVLEQGPVEVRSAPAGRSIHAKVYCSPAAITLGSSNYTTPGMGRQSEANVRFLAEDERYQEARELAEGLWSLGVDYRGELLALLDRLLAEVSWQEALARAVAEVLEGEWAKKYVPPDELDRLEPPLWPHQLQGISQAIWIVHHRGSVLVADATGSGKTRMGVWLLRAAYDRQVRGGHMTRIQPVVVVPPQVVPAWEDGLRECGLGWSVSSHGPLSNRASASHLRLVRSIAESELLAVDEAHNFLNRSQRTHRLRAHYADTAVLFTATPINRGATDLLSLVELLGPDHFPDTALDALQKLGRLRRSGASPSAAADRETLRREVERFMVRRTRHELNRIVDNHAEQYRREGQRTARYPRHVARYYDVPAPESDLAAAAEIERLADRLLGVARLGKKLVLPRVLAIDGMTEGDYLRRVVRSVAALARHFVLDCLRSSRVALYEHVHGTAPAIGRLAPDLEAGTKAPTGDTLGVLARSAGHPPDWRLQEDLKADAPAWLWDAGAHRAACEQDAAIYQAIGEQVAGMTGTREAEKVDHLGRLVDRCGLVIAFDSHVLSLKVFEHRMAGLGVPVSVFSGQGGAGAKRRAMRHLGPGSDKERLAALCTDAFSEAMNLQGASVVVHLDTPTVIRTAEQRAGRVDRMDSLNDQVEIWWPRDPPGFAPRKKELLRERHEVVSELIGANLQMPGDDDVTILTAEELARQADIEARDDDPQDFFDAFRSVRALVDDGGIVGPEIYDRMRTSQAEVVSCISLVRASRPWGFFAICGLDRVAPRWVLLDGHEAPPVADLGEIATALAGRLGDDPQRRPIDERAKDAIGLLVRRLRECERALLPMRRQRALALAERVLDEWHRLALSAGDLERARLLQGIRAMLGPAPEAEPHPDPRTVADRWLRVVRPIQQKVRAESSRRRRLWKLDALFRPLVDAPVDTATLQRAFADVPLLAPVSERVVAMIVGVPEEVLDE